MTNLRQILATTEKHIKALAEIGIESVSDLLRYYPRTHLDVSDLRQIGQAVAGEENTLQGELSNLRSVYTRTGKMLVQAKLFDAGGVIDLKWWNGAYAKRALKNGDEIVVTGKVQRIGTRHELIVTRFEKLSEELIHAARIVPVYRQHGKLITVKWLREKIFPLIKHAEEIPDFLPQAMVQRQDLLPLGTAIRSIHFPESWAAKEAARQRLAFDELFLLQLSGLRRKLDWQRGAAGSGTPIIVAEEILQEFYASLPWSLTAAQHKVIAEILADLTKDLPMNRLLEGDVGSGKTVVAALTIFAAVRSGQQAALLAPTEILSAQHFRNFLQLLHPLGIRAELLTGSTPASRKKEICARLQAGELDLVVGTHALLEERVQFKKLALAVIDEQHRFGVNQRLLLKKESTPHVLSLTATPIPRSLALTIFGDQDLSIIDELPPGRQEILTRVVPQAKRIDSYRWIESQIAAGRQVFIVCPLVEESETLEVKSAKAEFIRLSQEVFPQFHLGLLHGKMKPREKDAVMADFAAGKTHILVATTVIEVGIDVPNASIMLIEAAERFGLAQLHQLRGRVGRGAHKSYCFLFTEVESPEGNERLRALESVASGFRLAEIDLNLRGPGEVFGMRQSGMPDLKMARLTDHELIQRSRVEAEQLLAADPELASCPHIAAKVAELDLRHLRE